MTPLLAELLAERFPSWYQIAWEKQHSADLVLGELDLVKHERRRILEAGMADYGRRGRVPRDLVSTQVRPQRRAA